MKNLIAILASSVCVLANAAAISLYNGVSYKADTAAKVAAVRALSSVADGTAVVKAESKLLAKRDNVVTSYFTNTTYQLVFSNGVNVVTNTASTDRELFPLPGPRALVSFTTNEVVTSTTVTNVEVYVANVFTNQLSSVTCSGGVGSNVPENAFIYPGDTIFFTGTAVGNVQIIAE